MLIQRKLTPIILSLLVLTLAACGGAAWQEFSPEGENFSVSFPGAPKETSQSVDTEAGAIDVHFYTVDQGKRAYTVAYSDYPVGLLEAADPALVLDGARDGAIGEVQGKLLSETKISLGKFPGREISVESADGELRLSGRFYLVGNRLYQVLVVTPKAEAGSEDVKKFLDSFQLR